MSDARQAAVLATETAITAKAERTEAAAAAPAPKPEPVPPAKEPPTPAPVAAKDGLANPPATAAAHAADDGDDGDENEDSATSDGANPTAPRPRKGVGKRIDELTREKYEERRAREQAEQRIRELEQRLQPPAAQHQPAPPAKGRPTLEQFNYDQDAYEQARDQWVIGQAKETWTQEQQQRETQRQTQERLGKFESRIAKFEQENPGSWDEVLRSPVQPSQLMRDVVADSDIGPAIALHLARNLDEAFAISQMQPYQQAVAMGRLEAKLQHAATPTPSPARPARNTTDAPVPPPVLPTGSPAGAISSDRMGIEDHIAAVRAQKLRKAQGN